MNTQTMPDKKSPLSSINWRLFFTLLVLVAIGLIALIPYGLSAVGQNLTQEMIPQLLIQFLGQLILYSVLLLAGLLLGKKIGLGTPLLSGLVEGKGFAFEKKGIGTVVFSGLFVGVLMILLDLRVFAPLLELQLQMLGEIVRPTAWEGFLASFYGGIVEEIMTRFFLLTLLAWVGSKISHTEDGRPTPAVMWISIILSTLIFGLGHLPSATVMGVPLTPLYIIRTLLLNSVGILYGWLYWKRGLESAMLAHFSTDLVVHMLGAILLA